MDQGGTMNRTARKRIVCRLMVCATVEQVCEAEGITPERLAQIRKRSPPFDAACAESIRACRMLEPRYPPPQVYLMTPRQRRVYARRWTG